jgi:hypothetical protein
MSCSSPEQKDRPKAVSVALMAIDQAALRAADCLRRR